MRASVWLILTLMPLARAAGPPEVSIRSGAYSPRPPTIAAQSNLVESAVTVYDPKGRPAGGFTVADFVLSDNGKPQPITVFSELHGAGATASAAKPGDTGSAPAQARSVALFFDDLHLSSATLVKVREAAAKLIAAGLPPGERLGIFTDSGAVTVDFTTDTAALLAALPRIKSQEDPGNRGMTVCPVLTPYTAYVISENLDLAVKQAAVNEAMGCDHLKYEEVVGMVEDLARSVWENSRHRSTTTLDVLKILVSHLGKQNGDRILILMSAGFIDDDRMAAEKNALIDAALRAQVVVHGLGTGGMGFSFPQMILLNAMADASAGTGGRLIHNNNDLAGALQDLASAPSVSYLLGFQAAEPDGKYHALKVSLAGRKGFRVESRPGYVAAMPAKENGPTQQRIDTAVNSHELLQDIPAKVRVIPAAQANGGYMVKVIVDIDARRIRFATQGKLHLQQLTFVTAIENGQGNFITGKQAVMDLRVTPATLASMQASGIHAVESFSLPEGDYTVREIVRELVQDHMAASSTALRLGRQNQSLR
jgi:VWFA-related protein